MVFIVRILVLFLFGSRFIDDFIKSFVVLKVKFDYLFSLWNSYLRKWFMLCQNECLFFRVLGSQFFKRIFWFLGIRKVLVCEVQIKQNEFFQACFFLDWGVNFKSFCCFSKCFFLFGVDCQFGFFRVVVGMFVFRFSRFREEVWFFQFLIRLECVLDIEFIE